MTTLTDSQRKAIQERGNLLVVAGAGTGKTSTLVHRCVSLLLEEACSLEEILMVTFTEAAAAQMRNRIRAELLRLQASLPADSPQASTLRKQIALLDTAHICTLHSFCFQLVRAHFYQLGIDPAVTVLDERQTAPLILRTLDALFSGYYAGEGPEARAVQELIRDLGSGDDQNIRGRLVKLHRHMQALDDPEGWLAGQEAIYQEETPVAWGRWFEDWLCEWRKVSLPELEPCRNIPAVELFIQTLAALPNRPSLEEGREALRRLREADTNDDNWPRGAKTKTRAALKNFLADLEFMAAAVEAGGLEEDWQWVRGRVCALLQMTREFTAAFTNAKRELGGLDFSDLEQFALRLLNDPSVAHQWQQRLRFIFVDECQDINRAQDAIITALSRETSQPNRFLVGDVKQSIYRFRLANPKIFCEYEELWREGQDGTRIALADNFRSREALLDFINPLFAALMRSEVGGVAYSGDVQLRFGSPEKRAHLSRQASLTENPRVELHLIDQTDTEADPAGGDEDAIETREGLLNLLAIEREARLVGLRLKALREEKHLIWDPEAEEFRLAEWRDMVVLLRSPAGKAEAFAKEFHRLAIPLSAARHGFFESAEIQDLLSLLKLIDNPLQDVPLLAVLRSPLAGFSLDELAEVRAHNQEKPFWAALKKFHQRPPDKRGEAVKEALGMTHSDEPGTLTALAESAWAKVDLFLTQFPRWRELARQNSLSQCLETTLSETHYEALLLAEPRGEERVANVRRLLGLASEYDPYRRQGLYRFLRFVEDQQEAEVELEPASGPSENVVRLMSIHKSKGLEFPVVVLAGLGGQFNFRDLSQDFLLHETYGLCPKVKPPGSDRSYPSLPYWLAGRHEKRELLGEEMRLLYVALTRARDTLILAGTCKDPHWSQPSGADVQVTTGEIMSARKYSDWLLMWLPQVTSPTDWLSEQEGRTALLRWKIYAANDPQLMRGQGVDGQPINGPGLIEELDEVSLPRFQDRMLWRYPFAAATVEPAIKRVSSLIWERAEVIDDAQLLFSYGSSTLLATPTRARTRPDSILAAAEIGSAHHRFLEFVSLASVTCLESLKQEAGRMLANGILTAEEAQALDLKALLAFWQSDIGAKILAQELSVHREIPFTARFSVQDLSSLNLCADAAALQDEYFVVRGKADLAVLLPKEIWLLDFKTDQFRKTGSEEKIQQYAPQLKLYALGLSRIYRRPVTNRWLHFLKLEETVTI